MSKSPNSLVWSVTHSDFDHKSFLVATMHVRDARAFCHLQQVIDAMDKVDRFYSEVDLDKLITVVDASVFLNSEGRCISHEWSKAKWVRKSRLLMNTLELDLSTFDRISPILLINEIAVRLLNSDHHEPLDLRLWREAKSKGLQLGGLETIDEQAHTMSHLDWSSQMRMLNGVLSNLKGYRRKTLKLVGDFEKGKVNSLYRSSRRDLGKMKRLMIDDRNKRMAERFIEYQREAPIMAAVGAGHFAGNSGILRLLKQSNFKVRPLPIS